MFIIKTFAFQHQIFLFSFFVTLFFLKQSYSIEYNLDEYKMESMRIFALRIQIHFVSKKITLKIYPQKTKSQMMLKVYNI